VSSRKPVRGLPKESTPGADNTPLDFQDTVSLKERMAMYKAAVSEIESSNSFAHVRYQSPYLLGSVFAAHSDIPTFFIYTS